MKYLSEFRDSRLTKPLLAELQSFPARPIRIMEICGTHTMAIFHHGLRALLPPGLQLISGPGCPVCVTSAGHIDAFVEIAHQKNVRVAIFGDLLRVPGSQGSLGQATAQGAKVEIVYSPMDALHLAERHPTELIVFFSVGFETTTPGVAATIMAAQAQQCKNFAIFITNKVIPPPLQLLLADPNLAIDGLLCPGHVSTIIGAKAYTNIATAYKLPCVVAGFEPADIIRALIMLLAQIHSQHHEVENAYNRAVTWQGNERARTLVDQVFEPCASPWRGMGVLPASGLALRPQYHKFDAVQRLAITVRDTPEPVGCLCGSILCGHQTPPDCPLFGSRCTPANPIGPCMVSSEGTCAAYYRYGEQ